MKPIDVAWVVLKRQTKLYNWIEDYPDKQPVKYYHGTHEKVRPLIHQQGLVPQNEYANNEDWFRQLDDHPDPQYHISDEEWEKMVAEHDPTVSFTPSEDFAQAFGSDMWGIRGEPLDTSHPAKIKQDSESRTKQIIPPEQLVFLGGKK